MTLSKLLENVTVRKMFQTLYGGMVVTHEVDVSAVAYDSRQVRKGDLFVAVRGTGFDGHRFAVDAIHSGAKVVVLDDDTAVDDSFCMHSGTVKVVVPDTRIALAAISEPVPDKLFRSACDCSSGKGQPCCSTARTMGK